MGVENIPWWGDKESHSFTGYHISVLTDVAERCMKDAISRFHEAEKNNPIMVITQLLVNIINIHSYEDRNRRICCLILAHVLMQVKWTLFPKLISSFYRHVRNHYIMAVNMFEKKTPVLYAIIVKYLRHCSDNFE